MCKDKHYEHSESIETDFTNGIICPHCGHEQEDTWEWDLQEDDFNEERCQKCDKEFFIEVHISISYTTKKDIHS